MEGGNAMDMKKSATWVGREGKALAAVTPSNPDYESLIKGLSLVSSSQPPLFSIISVIPFPL